MIDWFDQTMEHSTEVTMVSQNNPDSEIGTLEGVDLGASSVSAAYYTDTRTSAKLSVVGDSWVRGSFIRISVHFPGHDRILGTYAVSSDPGRRQNGVWTRSLTLQSMLKLLALHDAEQPVTFPMKASAMKGASQLLDGERRQYLIDGGDYAFSAPTVYDSGQHMLKRLMDYAALAGNRVDVDGDGTVTLRRYQEPSKRPASFVLDLEDSRGIVQNGIQFSSDLLSLPTRYAVVYRWSDGSGDDAVQREIGAWADRNGKGSAAQRGYIVSDFRVLSELSPATRDAAQAEADRALADSSESVEWKIATPYLPLWEGDTVDLVVHDGYEDYRGIRHCLVKNMDINLRTLAMSMTLKEVG